MGTLNQDWMTLLYANWIIVTAQRGSKLPDHDRFSRRSDNSGCGD